MNTVHRRDSILGLSRRSGLVLLALIVLLLGSGACKSQPGAAGSGSGDLGVSSPDGSLTISLSLDAKPQPYLPGQRLYYRVAYKGTTIIADSPLGLDFLGAGALDH